MTENMAMLLINGFSLLMILILQILIPSVSRRNILLGVRIPKAMRKGDKVKKIIRAYIRENIIIGIIGIIFSTYLLKKYNGVVIMILSPIVYIGILFLIYIRWNKKVKNLKEEEEWDKLAENVVAVNAKFSRDKRKEIAISRKWYVIPLLIILGNTILSLSIYPSLPERIPSHWNFQGKIDGYMNKSYLTVLMMPGFQLLIGLMMYLAHYSMIRSKQEIDSRNPDLSMKKNLIFRKVWGIFFLLSTILLEILFTIINMMVLGIIQDSKYMTATNILVVGLMVGGSIILGLGLGQGGERLSLDDEGEFNNYDVDDDNLWKLGNSIYYNRDDPSLFVEKRVGVGWTVNGGRPLGMIILVLPLIIIIATIFLVK